MEAFVETPKGKPDLWVVINVMLGAAGFGICYLWCTWQLILRSGVMDEYHGFREEMMKPGSHEAAFTTLPFSPKSFPLPIGGKGNKANEGKDPKGGKQKKKP